MKVGPHMRRSPSAAPVGPNCQGTLGNLTLRVLQRLLALTAATWHNDAIGETVKRSLLAYDH